ncbi:pre-rRNA-processing protein TSR1 [Entomortierella parvispora]|uniref:Pre-rRNA-processing protein TSR1 n=1 Tax=Entomortierella parvispora TaxID=205924 RepID=A0A9P3HLG5_9FUNG|nr:pre-rRNA-processing protein TSR1 [Entomortierella parvispora]
MSEHQHRPNTKLKQQNKPFKSKHLTKSSLRDKEKGKVERVSVKTQSTRGISNRFDRRNAARLLQQKKREELFRKTKIFDGKNGTPKVIAVVPLCADVNADDAVANLFASVEQVPANKGAVLMTSDRFKQKLQFIPLQRNYIDIMDAAKVADFIVFVMSAVEEVDEFGLMVLAGIQSQGVPSVVPSVNNLEQIPMKKRSDIKKSLLSFTTHFFPEEDKVHALDNPSEGLNVLRMVANQLPKTIAWRDTHSYMLAESVDFVSNPSDPSVGTLKVTGYARGTHFNANRLVHLQNFGDYQLEKITSAPVTHRPVHVNSMDAEGTETVLDAPVAELQDDLAAENEPDLLGNEQTWPTEEELMEAEERVKNMDPSERPEQSFNSVAPKKAIRRVPKGTSNYQAAWIIDSDHESDDEHDEDDMEEDDRMDDDDLPSARDNEDSGEEYEDLEEEAEEEEKDEEVYEDELEDEEEARQYAAYLEREKENRDDMEFPDEVEAPTDVAAQVRFARYRALESFRTSPWDPYENLPLDYGRIFQFENFRRTKHRVMNQAKEGGVLPGLHITLHIANVPASIMDTYSAARPFIVFGLLQYEHKMGVINFLVNRNSEYDGIVKAKDPLVLHCGFRRFVVRPIFSQNSRNGKGTNNVHKSERFLQHGRSTVVTVYAPIQFGNLPVVLTRDTGDVNAPALVATGTLMDADPRRIVAKRIILTGHPFKVHKRTATIRFMFFNPDDVWYYKSVELRTKHGRTGHIKESLGTHGYFKAQWDQQISMQDTVMMCLYKRIYPKWGTTLWVNPAAGAITSGAVESMDMD